MNVDKREGGITIRRNENRKKRKKKNALFRVIISFTIR